AEDTSGRLDAIFRMHVTIPCSHCGRSLNAPGEFLGRMVRCTYCKGEFILRETAPKPARSPDRTVSRSMLLKIPNNINVNVRPGAADAMVCRLEPDTLRLVQASEAFESFVGPATPGRSRSLLD